MSSSSSALTPLPRRASRTYGRRQPRTAPSAPSPVQLDSDSSEDELAIASLLKPSTGTAPTSRSARGITRSTPLGTAVEQPARVEGSPAAGKAAPIRPGSMLSAMRGRLDNQLVPQSSTGPPPPSPRRSSRPTDSPSSPVPAPLKLTPHLKSLTTIPTRSAPAAVLSSSHKGSPSRSDPNHSPEGLAAGASSGMRALEESDVDSSPVRKRPRTENIAGSSRTRGLNQQGRPCSPTTSQGAASPGALLSPAKDLSDVFKMFTDVDTTNASPTKGKNKMLARTGGGLLGRVGLAEAITLVGGPAGSRALNRAPSLPLMSPLGSPRASAPGSPRGSYTSQPHASTSHANPPPSPTRDNSTALSRASTVIGGTEGGRAPGAGKRTYGEMRSYKRDEAEEKMFGLSTADDDAAPQPNSSTAVLGAEASALSPSPVAVRNLPPAPLRERETYAVLRRRWGVDLDDDSSEINEGLEASDLKSITQLRARGENARFVDEFNYLVEGLEPGMGLGVRRASAIEVLRKMLDKEFLGRLKTSGFAERVYVEFRKASAGDGDRILDSSLAFLIAFISRDQRIAEPILRVEPSMFVGGSEAATDASETKCDVLVLLAALLDRTWVGDVLGGTIKGVPKQDIRSLATIREIVDKSRLMEDSTLPISARSLCLVAISVVASFAPRPAFRPQHLICTSGALAAVVRTLIHETRGLEARMLKYETGLDFLPLDGSISLDLIDTCLRICEACTAAAPAAPQILTTHVTPLVLALSDLILACHIIACDTKDAKTSSAAMDCLLSALRMLIELTTANPDWSIALASTPLAVSTLIKLIVATRTQSARKGQGRFRATSVSGRDDDERGGVLEPAAKSSVTLKFDVLCLALGVLTNLVETADGVKETLRDTLIDPTCKEQRRCARRCQCPGRTTAVDRLVELFLDPLDDSTNEVETSFINGYAGILLGLVMLDAPRNQDIVTATLATHPIARTQLLEAMSDFASLHDTSWDADGDNGKDMAVRIRDMIASLRAN